jgi:predicted secreted protein
LSEAIVAISVSVQILWIADVIGGMTDDEKVGAYDADIHRLDYILASQQMLRNSINEA